MPHIQLTTVELNYVVKGLMVLRDRAYNSYYTHKDQQSDTAQKNLKLYQELEDLRMEVLKTA